MNKPPLLLVLILFTWCSLAQNVFIKRDNKLVGLSQLRNIKIYQNISYRTSVSADSVNVITDVDSLYKFGDTLVVRPWVTEEKHVFDTAVNVTVQKVYNPRLRTQVKIPISEIDILTGKRRSLSRLFSFISTASFISVATSIPLRLSNPDNQAIGNTIFLIAAPTLVVSWTLQATVAKKRYHFDKKRTDKNVWSFN